MRILGMNGIEVIGDKAAKKSLANFNSLMCSTAADSRCLSTQIIADKAAPIPLKSTKKCKPFKQTRGRMALMPNQTLFMGTVRNTWKSVCESGRYQIQSHNQSYA